MASLALAACQAAAGVLDAPAAAQTGGASAHVCVCVRRSHSAAVITRVNAAIQGVNLHSAMHCVRVWTPCTGLPAGYIVQRAASKLLWRLVVIVVCNMSC